MSSFSLFGHRFDVNENVAERRPRAQKAQLLELNRVICQREHWQKQLRQVDQILADWKAAGHPGSIPLLQRRSGLLAEFERVAAHERALRARLGTSAA